MSDFAELKEADFRFVADLVYGKLGIRMGGHKMSLVASRLAKRVRALGLEGYSEYFDIVRSDPGGEEEAYILDHLTTNHTYFYRERDHFDFLAANVLAPGAGRAGGEAPRIWSAGCASGEEPYGIAIAAREAAGPRGALPSILATDFSSGALSEAVRGIYPEAKLRELPPPLRASYFDRRDDGTYAVRPDIRGMVLFKRLNLLSDRFPFKGLFDAIFCRNVMIYFDAESRAGLLKALHAVLRMGGYLFIGHSESIARESTLFRYQRPAVYRKEG